MLASSGEMTAPCGVPLSAATRLPSSIAPALSHSEQAFVAYPVFQKSHHPLVVDGVEECADVRIQYPVCPAAFDPDVQRIECVVLAFASPKSIRESEEVLLVDRVQYGCYRLLHDLVFQRGDPERALLAVRLEDVDAPARLRTVGPGVYLPVQFVHARVERFLVFSPRHAVHPDRGVPAECVEALFQ